MNVEQKVERLRANVRAALDEFDLVMKLYDTWHPTAYDRTLFRRMGESFASHAFHVIREALQREIVIGLTKLWDTGDRAIRMDRVGDYIRSQGVIRALAVERAARFPFPGVEAVMERDLGDKAKAALAIIDSYLPKGRRRSVHDGLHKLRNTRFCGYFDGFDGEERPPSEGGPNVQLQDPFAPCRRFRPCNRCSRPLRRHLFPIRRPSRCRQSPRRRPAFRRTAPR